MPDWSRIHREKRFGAGTLPLALFSVLYGAGVRFRLSAYEKGIFRGKSLPGFVVSVGNLTAGGTGKTPAVAMLAKWALGEGHHVAVLSKGYGGRYKQDVLEVSDGERICADARVAGDESCLLAKEIAGSPVIISRSRYRGGMYAHEKFGSDFFILDDGFQHLELERDLNLALVDGRDPFGNGHLLPWGPLREPLSQLRRADAIILTRFCREQEAGSREQGKRTLALLKERFPSIPLFCADHLPDKVVFPASGEVHDPGFLRKKRVLAFAGIAHPEHFEETLIGLGAEVIEFRGFRDHHPFNKNELQGLVRVKERIGAQYLLTTEKDWMRIAPVWRMQGGLAFLRIRFDLLPGQNGVFRMISDGLRDK